MSDQSGPDDDELTAAGRRAMRELADAPPGAIRRAEALWPRAPRLLERVHALLAVDSWTTAMPALRSGGRDERHLLFTAGDRDIEVRVAAGPDGWTLQGQVLGPAEDAALRFSRDGELVRVVALDDLGAFRAEGLRDGRYVLALYCTNECVELPEIALVGSPAP
jgi:hypothetical protein